MYFIINLKYFKAEISQCGLSNEIENFSDNGLKKRSHCDAFKLNLNKILELNYE